MGERGGRGGAVDPGVCGKSYLHVFIHANTHTHIWQDISASLIELGSVAKPDARVEAYRAKRRYHIICQSHEVVMG